MTHHLEGNECPTGTVFFNQIWGWVRVIGYCSDIMLLTWINDA